MSIRNPYLKQSNQEKMSTRKASSQSSESSSESLSTSQLDSQVSQQANENSIPTSKPEQSTKELMKQIKEYNLQKDQHQDLNTSYSKSGQQLRQRKQLRSIQFELQSLVCYPMKYDECIPLFYLHKTDSFLDLKESSRELYQVLNHVHDCFIQEYRIKVEEEEDRDKTLNVSVWEQENENQYLVALLDFMDTVYSVLDCDLVFQSLARAHYVDEEEYTVLECFLGLLNEEGFDSLQQHLFGIMCKALLNVEFIYNYASSLTILPKDGYDSLLGKGMGLGLDHCELQGRLKRVTLNVFCEMADIYAKEKTGADSQDSEVERKIDWLEVSCLSFLAFLYRTNLLDVHDLLLEFDQGRDSNFHYMILKYLEHGSDELKQAQSFDSTNISQLDVFGLTRTHLKLSLLVMMKDKDCTDDGNTVHVNDTVINSLIQDIILYKATRIIQIQGLLHYLSVHTMIHICKANSSTHIRTFSKSKSFASLIGKAIQKFSAGDTWRLSTGLSLILTYLFARVGPSMRKYMSAQCRRDANTLPCILDELAKMYSSSSIMSTISAHLLMKCLLIQDVGNNQSHSKDDLANNTRELLLKNARVLSALNKNESQRAVETQAKLDFILFLLRENSFSQRICENLDKWIPTYVALVKCIDIDLYGHSFAPSIQLNAAEILCNIRINRPDVDGKAIERLMSKFVFNLQEEHSQFGAFDYALTQRMSRDLLRRALNLQSLLPSVCKVDAFDVANLIFSSSSEISQRNDQLEERMLRKEQEVDVMFDKCKKLTMERNRLEDQVMKMKKTFDLDLRKRVAEIREMAEDNAESSREEKKLLSKELAKSKQEINNQKEIYLKLTNELKEERKQAGEREKKTKEEVVGLKQELAKSEQSVQQHTSDLCKKSSELSNAMSTISDLKASLGAMKSKNANISSENEEVKRDIEVSLSNLIGLTQILNQKEKENLSEQQIVMKQLQDAIAKLENVETKSRNTEEKYSLVKDKYRELKQMYEDEVKKRRDEKKKYEKDLIERKNRDKERRRQEKEISESRQEKERQQKESRRRDDARLQKDKSDRSGARKPMGTIDFMNSIHNTSASFIQDSTKESSTSRSLNNDRRKRTGNFKIVK